MAKKTIVANWKMNLSMGQASLFLHKLQQDVSAHRDVEAVICPSMLALQPLSLQVERRKFKLGAQNCYFRDEGAFTGEVSAAMLRNLVDYVIVGHSERRHIFGETDRIITQKVQAVLRNNMQPILCVGETHNDRIENETLSVLHGQVSAGLANVVSDEINQIVIAYEPVWAIGTGEFAPVADVAKAVDIIRKQVKAMFGSQASKNVRILYGGSVDSANAITYLRTAGIDGLLVGGASLKAKVFAKIIEDAHLVASA
ncbi:MAG: triose-phosphate isomerase [Candidatus Woesebacteria bacterium]|jgi:triosephosphate isomerase